MKTRVRKPHTLGQLCLNELQRKIVLACVNRYGSALEPEATKDAYPLLMDTYAADCVQRGLDKKVFNDEQRPLAEELLTILRGF